MRSLIIVLLLTLGVSAQTGPDAVVAKLYGWLEKVGENAQKRLPEIQSCLTPELYDQLTRAYAKDPNTGEFLDFDPWSNTQMGADHYHWGKARMVGGQAKSSITVDVHRGGTVLYTVVLTQAGDSWKVANLVYSSEMNLLSVLKDLNKAP